MQLPQQFNAEGGTELAPMSTTTDVSVAISYAVKKDTRSALVFRFVTRNNLERGADVQWLSMFSGEAETLFPPLTFLCTPAENSHRTSRAGAQRREGDRRGAVHHPRLSRLLRRRMLCASDVKVQFPTPRRVQIRTLKCPWKAFEFLTAAPLPSTIPSS
jgi:hypothetical protein